MLLKKGYAFTESFYNSPMLSAFFGRLKTVYSTQLDNFISQLLSLEIYQPYIQKVKDINYKEAEIIMP
jgi:hypothetical protein